MKQTFILAIVIFIFFATADIVSAGNLPMGAVCKTSAECKSNDCEKSTKTDSKGSTLSFCDCHDADSCVQEYGGTKNDWTCTNGADMTWDLDYCFNEKNTKETKFAISPKDANFLDHLLDPTIASSKILDEVKNIKPTPRIEIPGLKFSSEPKAVEEGGSIYLYLPYLGEYLAALYKYAVVAIGVLAVFLIINHGFGWVMSGGNPEKINVAKKRIGEAIIGLFLAVGSYTLLYTINPNLVQFKSLKIKYVEKMELTEEQIAESENKGNDNESTESTMPEKELPKDYDNVNKIASGNDYFCTPAKKSTKAEYTGLNINYTQLGRLDCNQSKGTRKPIAKIVLHEGFGPGGVKPMVTMWRRNYMGFDYVCGSKKDGNATAKCKKENKKDGETINYQTPASSHYAVDKDGTIYQLSGEEFIQPHCAGTEGHTGCNSDSIGIDLLVASLKAGLKYSDAQLQSLGKLIKAITQKYKLPVNDSVVHAHADCQENRSDPRDMEWEKLGKYAGGSLSSSAHPKTVQISPLPQKPPFYQPGTYSCN